MLAFWIFLIVLMLIELCWKMDSMQIARKNEYHIFVIKHDKNKDEEDSKESPTFGKNRINF